MTAELKACQQQALAIATDFRCCESIRAQHGLPTLIEQLILHFPMRELSHVQHLKTIAKGIRMSQENRDWLGIADYLDYELQGLLQHYL
jgi:hypothetical protein